MVIINISWLHKKVCCLGMFWTREKDLQAVRKQKKTHNLTWLSVIVNSLFKKTYFWRERREICVEKANENKQKPTFCLRRSLRFFCFLAGQHCFPNWKQRMFSWRRNNKRTTETATCVCFTNHTSSNGFLLLILLFFFKRKRWQCICLQKRSCFNSFKKSYSLLENYL